MIIGYHATTEGITNSVGDRCTQAPYLQWLLDNHPDEGPKVFYDLDAAVAALLRLVEVTRDEGVHLLHKGKLFLSGYRIKYIPGKFFSIDLGYGEGHQYSNFYNMGSNQYAETTFSPDTSLDYAEGKAKAAAKTGSDLTSALAWLGLPTDSLVSPIAAFDRKYFGRTIDPPTWDDMPEAAAEMAYESVKRNWLECWQMGHWETAYDYDINGAYGAELAKLLDIRRGSWVHSRNHPEGAVYGFARGELTTWAEFHPFLVSQPNRATCTPVSTWPDTLPLSKIQLMHEYGLGEFDIADGWWWVPEGNQYELLKGAINWLWDKRWGASPLQRAVVKKITAGIWGRTLEIRGTENESVFGQYFNPCYGATVEANTSVRVAEACLEAGVLPLHVAVDGMITDRELGLPLGDHLGEWRLSHKGECIICSAGAVAFEGKGGEEEFSLHLDWLKEQIVKGPKAASYSMSKWSPVSVAYAINTDFSTLGTIRRAVRTVTVGSEPKRMWRLYPKCGGDLWGRQYKSSPWEYSVIAVEEE